MLDEEKDVAEADGGDDVENETDQENNENESEQSDSAGDDGKAEDGKAESDGGEVSGEDSKEDGDGKPSELEALKALLAQTNEKLKAVENAKNEQVQENTQQAQLSDEQWARISEEWGMDRRGIEKVTAQNAFLYKKVIGEVEKMIAPFRKEQVISRMEKDENYKDIRQHMTGIEEFLANFDEGQHSNEKLLALGLMYARGKGLNKAVRNAANTKERNKKIASSVRPASPSSGSARKPSRGLSEMEKQAAKLGGMSEEEYMKTKGNRAA